MLECAKQLETFETYKLQGAQGCLKFASNFLTKINLHRAECLDSLVVYAPRLEKLSLQVCFWNYLISVTRLDIFVMKISKFVTFKSEYFL